MNSKLKSKIESFTRKAITKASLGEIKDSEREKIVRGYMKFLEVSIKAISIAGIFIIFGWFFPEYVGLPYDRMSLFALLLILAHLRYGTTDVEFKN